jgi:hypothetical protein
MSNRTPAKTFGSPRRGPAERVPIALWVEQDDESIQHHFLARRVDNFAAMVMTAIHAGKNESSAMAGMMATIARTLDNRDGVPVDWEPTLVEPPRSAGTLVLEQDEPEWPGAKAFTGELAEHAEPKHVPSFRAPAKLPEDHPLAQWAGQLISMDRADEFTKIEYGSSRRRWAALMSDESDVTIQQKDLMDLFEYLTSLAAGRPTQPSS